MNVEIIIPASEDKIKKQISALKTVLPHDDEKSKEIHLQAIKDLESKRKTMKSEKEEIIDALETLGYDIENTVIEITDISLYCYEVVLNGAYFGIYDTYRNTFVD